jgi:hypothetical protein
MALVGETIVLPLFSLIADSYAGGGYGGLSWCRRGATATLLGTATAGADIDPIKANSNPVALRSTAANR